MLIALGSLPPGGVLNFFVCSTASLREIIVGGIAVTADPVTRILAMSQQSVTLAVLCNSTGTHCQPMVEQWPARLNLNC